MKVKTPISIIALFYCMTSVAQQPDQKVPLFEPHAPRKVDVWDLMYGQERRQRLIKSLDVPGSKVDSIFLIEQTYNAKALSNWETHQPILAKSY